MNIVFNVFFIVAYLFSFCGLVWLLNNKPEKTAITALHLVYAISTTTSILTYKLNENFTMASPLTLPLISSFIVVFKLWYFVSNR